jgi:hypothetical protein
VRPSAEAFRDDRDGSPLSVYLQSVVDDLGLSAGDVVAGKGIGWGVSATSVDLLNNEEQEVVPDPVVDSEILHPCDAAHAVVVGDKSAKARRNRIAAASRIVFLLE